MASNLPPGTQIGGYRLEQCIGSGGMGTVYLARGGDGRAVAVKVIHERWLGDAGFRERFTREVAAARRVSGFCTARVVDADPYGAMPYLVTEYVDGPSLHTRVNERGALSESDVEALAVGVAAALTAVHAAGVVHRDLTPRNVLLSPFGPKVIDFGVARAVDSATVHTGVLFGTPGWLAPEVLRGGPVGPAADVYSWGLLIAWAGTGKPVDVHSWTAGGGGGPGDGQPAVPGVPPRLAPLVLRAVHPDPQARPSARELLLALCGSTDGDSVRTVLNTLAGPAPLPPTLVDPLRPTTVAPVRTPAHTRALPPALPPARPPVRARPAPGPQARPAQWPQVVAAPPRRRRRRRGRIIALLVLVGVCGLCVLDRAGGKDDQQSGSGQAAPQPTTVAPTKRSSTPATRKPSPTPTLGTARDGGLEFTLTGLRCGVTALGEAPLRKQAQGQFCLVDMRITNIGQKSARVWMGSQHLIDANGRDFPADEWAWVYNAGSRSFTDGVNPGNSVTGTLVFDTPAGLSFRRLVVHDSPLSRGTDLRLP